MENHIESRLKSIYQILMAGYHAGINMSSATKGSERELFVEEFLKQVFPNNFRFGNGDVVDYKGNISGQIDIVVEAPFLYSFPAHSNGPRLYPAESVAAVIEVKSDLTKQWKQVERTVNKIKILQRRFLNRHYIESGEAWLSKSKRSSEEAEKELTERSAQNYFDKAKNAIQAREKIPIYVIGFKGWKDKKTIKAKRIEMGLQGLIVLEDDIKGSFDKIYYGDGKMGVRTGNISGMKNLIILLDSLYSDAINNKEPFPGFMNYR